MINEGLLNINEKRKVPRVVCPQNQLDFLRIVRAF